MTPLDELSGMLQGPSRAVVIAKSDVDLQSLAGENDLFVLVLPEGSSAAGGRGGGFGERKVVKVARFRYSNGVCEKMYDAVDDSHVSEFEVPFHVARMPMTLRDGTSSVGYGVVDPDVVSEFIAKTGSPT